MSPVTHIRAMALLYILCNQANQSISENAKQH